MNITRTHTLTFSGRELRAALKQFFPSSHIVQAMPDENGRVTTELSGTGLTLRFSTDIET